MATKRNATVGDIVLLHTKDGDVPVLVTVVNDDDTVSGQAFLAGTERALVENIGNGKGDGQFGFKD